MLKKALHHTFFFGVLGLSLYNLATYEQSQEHIAQNEIALTETLKGMKSSPELNGYMLHVYERSDGIISAYIATNVERFEDTQQLMHFTYSATGERLSGAELPMLPKSVTSISDTSIDSLVAEVAKF